MNSHLLQTDYLKKLSELLLDNVSDAIISTDKNLRIKTWNKAAEKIYNLSFYEVKDRLTSVVFDYEFLNDSLEISRKKLFESGEWKGVVIFTRNDGRKVFLNVSVSKLHDENDETIGFVSVNRDITDAYQVKDILQNEKRMNVALQGAGDGVWEYNFKTKEAYYSPEYKKMLGFSEHEFLDNSREWRDRIHPEDLVLVDSIDVDYNSRKIESHSIEYRIKNKAGNYIWVLDRGMILEKTAEGKPLRVVGTQANIDSKKRAEEKIRSFLESAPDAMVIVDAKGKIEIVNTQAEKLFGYSRGEMIGKLVEYFIPDRYFDSHRLHRDNFYKNARTREMGRGFELFAKRKDGREVPVEISLSPIDSEEGLMVSAAIRDITERKKAEQALLDTKAELLKSIERYAYASKATSDAIWDWEINTDTIHRGEGFKTIFGYAEAISSLEIRIKDLIHPDDRERVRIELKKALEGDIKHWQGEYRFRCANGDYKQVIDRVYVIRDETGKAIRVIGAIQDVTEQRRLQEQLIKEEERKKKEVLQAIIHAQERERHEISHELHDNVSQILTTCKLLLDAAIHRDDKKYLHQSRENLQKAIDEMRNISHRLNPATLKFIGLEGSINDLLSKINNAGVIEISFSFFIQDVSKIHDDVQLAIFRIVQEQVNNIVKHAEAQKVFIDLSEDRGKLKLTISDDGKGYDLKVKKHGLGLRNIFNRAEFHKGTAQIFTEPGKGFKLQVQIPIEV